MSSIVRYCLDRRVIVVLGVAGVGMALLAPRTFGAALPLLLLVACPLSMVAMAVAMGRAASATAALPTGASPNIESMRTELTEVTDRHTA